MSDLLSSIYIYGVVMLESILQHFPLISVCMLIAEAFTESEE